MDAFEGTRFRRERDRLSAQRSYLAGACVGLAALSLWLGLHRPSMPAPLACPNMRETMQLDPEMIRSRPYETVEL